MPKLKGKRESIALSLQDIEILTVRWFFEHPNEKYPKWLYDLQTQYFIKRWEQQTGRTRNV